MHAKSSAIIMRGAVRSRVAPLRAHETRKRFSGRVHDPLLGTPRYFHCA